MDEKKYTAIEENQKNVEESLRIRLEYEKLIASSSAILLSEKDKNTAIKKVFANLLTISGATCIHLFENFEHPTDGLSMKSVIEVSLPESSIPIETRHIPYKITSNGVKETFLHGDFHMKDVSHMHPDVMAFFKPYGAISTLAIPVFLNGNLYGCISFSDSRKSRYWSEEDIRLLKTASEMIQNYIEKKMAEEALRESEERLRTLINAMPDIVCFKDGEGRWLEANNFDLKLFQLEGVDYQGKKDSELAVYSDFYREAFLSCEESDEKAWLNHDYSRGEEVIPRPDGENLIFDIIKVPIFHHDGRRKGIVVVGRDVTERKKAENALRDMERHFEIALETTHSSTFDIHLQTGKMLTSPALYIHLGYSPDEIPESLDALFSIVHPDDVDVVKKAIDNHVSDITSRYYVEFRVISGSGQWVWCNGTGKITHADEEGNPLRLFGVYTDITGRKKEEEKRRALEIKIQHAQKLESLGVLAGGIAHDFNNLLMAILGHSELALMDLSELSPVRQSIEDILAVAKRAAELTKQMLAYSGKGKFVIKSVNLSELITEMTHMIEVSISKKAVLKFDFNTHLPFIECDISQIRQVVMNLIINASDLMENRSGVIKISTGVMDCNSSYLEQTWLDDKLPEGSYVYLKVTDTGCGMDKDTIGRVFDPFFSTKFTGRGLGLAAVLGIVRGHKGAIKVESEPGKGTTFIVLFPVSKRVATDITRDYIDGKSWTGKGTVLLVDDEVHIRIVGKQYLQKRGFNVLLAEDGCEGLELFKANHEKICCVLLDLTMPKMSGQETLKEIRKIRQDTPVLIFSGYNEQEVKNLFGSGEISGFIQKPYDLATLGNKIKEIVGQ